MTSWSQFVDVFGGVTAMVGDGVQSCPGYLPRAVRAFFDQGGEVAWVCRVVPRTDDPSATARYVLAGGRALVAASEGSWGGRLRVTLSFQSGPPLPAADRSASDAVAPAADELVLPDIRPCRPVPCSWWVPRPTIPPGPCTGSWPRHCDLHRPAAGSG